MTEKDYGQMNTKKRERKERARPAGLGRRMNYKHELGQAVGRVKDRPKCAAARHPDEG